MAPYWRSHARRNSSPVPLALRVKGSAYQHLLNHTVRDGITRAKVDSHTTIASLYNFKDESINKDLVRDLKGIAEPLVPCEMKTSDGTQYPPASADSEHNYKLKLSYNTLYSAPTVRLECHFTEAGKRSAQPYLTLVNEFHFNDHVEGEDTEIRHYKHGDDGILRFETGRATHSGFDLVSAFKAKLTAKDHEIIEALQSMHQPKKRHELKFRFQDRSLTAAQRIRLANVRDLLPNGRGPLLPSIGMVEYAAFGESMSSIEIGRDCLQNAKDQMSCKAPNPMVPQDASPIFRTIKEAAVQLTYSASIADAESAESLRLWAETTHKGQLYTVGNFAVIGVKFRNFEKLGSIDEDLHFRLPRELGCVLKFRQPRGDKMEVQGFLMSTTPNLPPHDAFFMITSHTPKEFAACFKTEASKKFDVDCDPHYNSFTYCSQLETIALLQEEKNTRWHDLLLNQTHAELKEIDLTEGIDPEMKAKMDHWLRNWMKWNHEQLSVIEGIRAAKGGVMIVMGPAATGKTLLQRALAIYFYCLGFHILALAPANSNANKLAKDMLEVKSDLPHVDFNRLFAGSRDIEPEEMTEEQAKKRKIGHDNRNVLPMRELFIALDEKTKEKGEHREYGVVESVIRAAEEGKLIYKRRERGPNGMLSEDFVNAWDELRQFIKEYREHTLDTKDEKSMERYRTAYSLCKGHIVGCNRFMITTTGNVRSDEMITHWFSKKEDYGVPRRGVIVFVDEAAKDLEVNVWAGIVCGKWADWVHGVFLFGDDKQLKPANTSAKGDLQFNYFSARLDMPLPNRLVAQGFPCYHLKEQRRMNTAISSFPNRTIYGGELRDGPGMDKTLNEERPGLREALAEIFADEMAPYVRQKFKDEVSDKDLRRHYVKVSGRRTANPSTKSMIVEEHIDVFFEKIFPRLQAYYEASGRSMNKEVMIICGYNYARSEYENRLKSFLARHPHLTEQDIPRVLTIDSSQGDEAYMVFFDASLQHGDVVGKRHGDAPPFMGCPHRFNVAVTRAKGILWTIGGSMMNRFHHSPPRPDNLATEYKMELDAAGQTHVFS